MYYNTQELKPGGITESQKVGKIKTDRACNRCLQDIYIALRLWSGKPSALC